MVSQIEEKPIECAWCESTASWLVKLSSKNDESHCCDECKKEIEEIVPDASFVRTTEVIK